MEGFDHLGNDRLELFEGDAGHGKGHAKAAFGAFDGFQKDLIGREIALLRDLSDDFAVFKSIEVVAVGIEDAIAPQTIRLMDLKIETDERHRRSIVRSAANDAMSWDVKFLHSGDVRQHVAHNIRRTRLRRLSYYDFHEIRKSQL